MKASYFDRLAALAASAMLLVFASGCGGPAKTRMDTSELVTAFASAEAPLKAEVDTAAKALASGKLLEGTTALAKLTRASHESLTEPQKTALVNLVTLVQTIMAEDGGKGDMNIYQAADDIIAGLEGKESTKVGITPDSVRPRQAPAE